MMRITSILTIVMALSALPACDLDVPDLNNPGLDQLAENPTPSAVTAACTGLVIGQRRNHAAGNGYVAQLGILGREAYNFDQADPRYIGELLQGTLNPGSPFGGNFWALPYANIQLGYTALHAVDKVPEFSTEERAGISGFIKTMIAIDLLEVIATRDDIGAVIDVDHGVDAPLGPIVDKTAVLTEIARLLDEGATELNGGVPQVQPGDPRACGGVPEELRGRPHGARRVVYR
jgi:starch-binding outer membrane protein, SusD/RagB family